MTKILVTGAGGMLAWDLCQVLDRHGVDFAAVGRAELDVTDQKAVASALDSYRPTAVWNAAAYTDVDGAETDRDTARQVNALAPAYLTTACSKRHIALTHFSTDQVFDGTARSPRTETDATGPLNFYATSKLQGEQAALEYRFATVLRVQWLYGERKDRFTIIKQKELFTPFLDQTGCPTWTRFIADITYELWQLGAHGLFHAVHDDWASWADVYAFVCSQLNYKTRLEPMLTEQAKLPAQRPKYSVLSNAKLRSVLARDSLGSWRTELGRFLATRT